MVEAGTMGIAAFDMDNLLPAASSLTNSDLRLDEQRWPAYNALWLTAMQAVSSNNILPVLFCPLTPQETVLANEAANHNSAHLHLLLLDCDNASRRKRLTERGWAAVRIDEACEDAAELRSVVDLKLSTDIHPASQLAREIVHWMRTTLP